jgi:hypothetical protein
MKRVLLVTLVVLTVTAHAGDHDAITFLSPQQMAVKTETAQKRIESAKTVLSAQQDPGWRAIDPTASQELASKAVKYGDKFAVYVALDIQLTGAIDSAAQMGANVLGEAFREGYTDDPENNFFGSIALYQASKKFHEISDDPIKFRALYDAYNQQFGPPPPPPPLTPQEQKQMDELTRKIQATWPTAEQLEKQRADEKRKEHELAVKQEAIREANGDFSQAPGLTPEQKEQKTIQWAEKNAKESIIGGKPAPQ